eukprot:CAMPEP_0195073082 /NCGR_PEP_ID=MMETSP0448-20130528/16499_1 /TAXON_ID=66468 /ORGANISM="Heterocapsa triquestra, Strain CCMP 448" /LENGTH=42 /DNA_ID= /DNA_START= /DNA_END= /DNA_ORIENTATION=
MQRLRVEELPKTVIRNSPQRAPEGGDYLSDPQLHKQDDEEPD